MLGAFRYDKKSKNSSVPRRTSPDRAGWRGVFGDGLATCLLNACASVERSLALISMGGTEVGENWLVRSDR
jgi:hypothetical protein